VSLSRDKSSKVNGSAAAGIASRFDSAIRGVAHLHISSFLPLFLSISLVETIGDWYVCILLAVPI